MPKKKIAIIGAGAAGCFCAVNIAEQTTDYEIFMYDAGLTPMHKLSLTGGGRCNLTNTFENAENLTKIYPRGDKLLRSLFYNFNHENTIEWFENHDIKLYAQDDGRIFPKSNKAAEIVDKLYFLMNKYGVWTFTGKKLSLIEKTSNEKFSLTFSNGEKCLEQFDYVIVATGGLSNSPLMESLKKLGIEIIEPVPSLFSLKVKSNILTSLMGATATNASVMIAGEKFRSEGGLLITHFGFSGPAVLKLSSYAARFLKENNYKCDLAINWLNESEDVVFQLINELIKKNRNKNILSSHPKNFTNRLWEFLISRAEIQKDKKFSELGKKHLNKLVNILTSDIYHVSGRGQFKDEFVTAGGVSLKSLNHKTLESKTVKNLFFAGEVLDIDAITGGYNLQAAWTTAKTVAENFTVS
ncbi:MAG: aminoacetone oxidase family FAD-binding enzyme [Candidatus Gastranaerophilales bacterium]|nr:aminoacetone oxidase family FAD-binding enzyme [Candidatus Gastranaerophilales bacterium]